MAKRSERKRLTKRLDDLLREFIRARDKNTCQHCGKKVQGSNSHPSHIIPKGRGASQRRFDPVNILLKCHHCHQWWHLNPTESGFWFSQEFPGRDKYLDKYRGGKPAPITTHEMRVLVDVFKERIKRPARGGR